MREFLIHTYGLTENERDFIKTVSPKYCTVSDDTDCFTDIVIMDAIAAVIRLDTLSEADKELFFDVYSYATDNQTIIFIGQPDIPKYFTYPLIFFDTFEDFKKELKSIVLCSYRKRYTDIYKTIDMSLSILSCVRKCKAITTEHLCDELDISREQADKYIKFLEVIGHWVYTDDDGMIQITQEQFFKWGRPNMCNTSLRRKEMNFNVGDILTCQVALGTNRYPGVVSKIDIDDDYTKIELICESEGHLYTEYCYDDSIQNLNYNKEELKGNEKILYSLSDHLKGNMDLPDFLEKYIEIIIQ